MNNISEAIEYLVQVLTGGKLRDDNNGEHLLIPQGMELHRLPNYNPEKKEGHRLIDRLESLIDYCNRHGHEPEAFINAQPGMRITIRAIMDPLTELHIADCRMESDQDFTDWIQGNGKLATQSEFAGFVEDHRDNFLDPDGATMLELAQTLKFDTDVKFSSSVKLTNGVVNLAYSEDIEGAAGRQHHLSIPETFEIGLPIFRGGTRYRFDCRLRYRVNKGNLAIGYKLDRPDRVFDHAIGEVVDRMQQSKIKCYYGEAGA